MLLFLQMRNLLCAAPHQNFTQITTVAAFWSYMQTHFINGNTIVCNFEMFCFCHMNWLDYRCEGTAASTFSDASELVRR